MDIYRQHAMQLLEKGRAYWCVCTGEELEARRKEALAKGLSVKYDGWCRDKRIKEPGQEAALRFRAPQEGQTVIEDMIKGRVVFENNLLDDLIILRSNGYPTYNFSVVVDDALMGITHVIRGDDHLTNTPRQVPIFQALGFTVPQFGHLSMIMGADKSRLSKRHGATSIMAYKDMGYLPEAMINYLVRLGWSHGDQEIFTRQELIETFSFEHVQKSAAVFNPEKLLWVNAQYIKQGDPKRLAGLVKPFFAPHGLAGAYEKYPEGWKEKLVVALQERAQTLAEMAEGALPYVAERITIDEKAAQKFLAPASAPVIEQLIAKLQAAPDFSKSALEGMFKEVLEGHPGMKMGQLAQPVRVALTGRTASPGIFDVMELLGRERVLARLRQGVARATASRP